MTEPNPEQRVDSERTGHARSEQAPATDGANTAQPAQAAEPRQAADPAQTGPSSSERTTWLMRIGAFVLIVGLAGFALDQRYGHRDRVIESEKDVDTPIAQVDGFNRPDSDQLAPPEASMWLQPEGERFGIRGGAAVVNPGLAEDGRAAATTSLPNQEDASQFPIGAFGLTIRDANEQSGIVVRYQDATHYWLISPSPKLGVWLISKIDGDTRTEMMSTQGILGTEDVTLWVEFRGDAIIVRSQGSLQATVTDPTFGAAASVGFLATGPGADKIQFDNAVIAFPAPK